MVSSRSARRDSSLDNGKKKDVVGAINIGVSPTDDDEMKKRFNACIKNDFPICLDEALQLIFGTSEKESVDRILQKARRAESGNLQNLTTPQGIWELYKRVIKEFQIELGESKCKVIETESANKMRLIHCEKCPLYEFELERLQNTYK